MSHSNAILGARDDIRVAAGILIELTRGDHADSAFEQQAKPHLDTLGWGPSKAPNAIDRKIEKAVQDLEKLCRPVLTAKRN